MSMKYSFLVRRDSRNLKSSEIRFYDSKFEFEKDILELSRIKGVRSEARISFNGSASCIDVLNDFRELFPRARIIDKENCMGLKFPLRHYSLLKEKFVDYFKNIGPLVSKRDLEEDDFLDMTVGDYYNKYLRKR